MKNLSLLSLLLLSAWSCDVDPCKEGYTEITENGSSFCVPDYVVGVENHQEDQSLFYHREHGLIEFREGKWFNRGGEDITDTLVQPF